MEAEKRRQLIGAAGVAAGLLTVALGVVIAHYTGLPETDAVGREILPDIPRGWQLVTLGQLIAVGGSQLIVIALFYGWVWERRLTWALAGFAALLMWYQLVLYFGIIPSEMLNTAQGPLGWTSKTAFTVPSWLVLGNTVEVSYKTLKDFIVAGYYTTMFIVLIIGVYQAQEWYKKRKAAPEPVFSDYGRPLLAGSPNGGRNGQE